MKVPAEKQGDSLNVHYGVLLNVEADLAPKDSYTVSDLHRALTRAILEYGYPKTGEVVTTEDGQPVGEETEITAGRYKMKFLMHTEDGMAEAFVTVE